MTQRIRVGLAWVGGASMMFNGEKPPGTVPMSEKDFQTGESRKLMWMRNCRLFEAWLIIIFEIPKLFSP